MTTTAQFSVSHSGRLGRLVLSPKQLMFLSDDDELSEAYSWSSIKDVCAHKPNGEEPTFSNKLEVLVVDDEDQAPPIFTFASRDELRVARKDIRKYIRPPQDPDPTFSERSFDDSPHIIAADGKTDIQQNKQSTKTPQDPDPSHTTTTEWSFDDSRNIIATDVKPADGRTDFQEDKTSSEMLVVAPEQNSYDQDAEKTDEEVAGSPERTSRAAAFRAGASRALGQYPYTLRSMWVLAAAFLLLILGCVLGAKASNVRTFWVVNVLSDALFAMALALVAAVSIWLYEAMLTARINHGVQTPVYMMQGLHAGPILEKGPREFRVLVFLAGLVTIAQLIADTGLDAEQTVVSKGNGLLWVAGDDCGAKEGQEHMFDGPNNVFETFARGQLSVEDMPVALLASDIYSGRVPDNGAYVERVKSSSEQQHVIFTAFFSETGNPIMEMPQVIPVTKVESVNLWPSSGRDRRLYTGPAFEPHLEGVAMDPPKAKQLWSIVLSVENIGGWLRNYRSASFDSEEWKEQVIEGEDGFYTYQSNLISPAQTEDNVYPAHILFVVHEKADRWIAEDPGLAAQFSSGDVEIPEGAWASHLITLGVDLDCRGSKCTVENKEEVASWSLITEGDMSLASLWAIWQGLPKETSGVGPVGIEDAARVVYAAQLACGEVTTGRVGEHEVRAVISAQWFLAYIFLLIYVAVCVVMADRILRKEQFVPIPKTWYDGYQIASCDLGQTSPGRDCAEPFSAAPATGINDPLYNIEDNGTTKSFDHLGVTKGPVVARVRSLRGRNMVA